MAKRRAAARNKRGSVGESSKSPFGQFCQAFTECITKLAEGGVGRIEDPEQREAAQVLAKTAVHISANIGRELDAMYAKSDAPIQTHLDQATNRMGGQVFAQWMLSLIDDAAAAAWSTLFKMVEALKKILRDILAVSVFGISPEDIFGVVFDIDEVLRVLDNILQTIGGLFGGKPLQQAMHETEQQNVKMTYELVRLKKLQYGS